MTGGITKCGVGGYVQDIFFPSLDLALTPHSKKVVDSILGLRLFCVKFVFLPCPCGFSLGSLVSRTGQICILHANMHVIWSGNAKVSVCLVCVWAWIVVIAEKQQFYYLLTTRSTSSNSVSHVKNLNWSHLTSGPLFPHAWHSGDNYSLVEQRRRKFSQMLQQLLAGTLQSLF